MKCHLHSLDLRQSERAEIAAGKRRFGIAGKRLWATLDALLGSPRRRPSQPSNGPLLEIVRALPVEGNDVLAGQPARTPAADTRDTAGPSAADVPQLRPPRGGPRVRIQLPPAVKVGCELEFKRRRTSSCCSAPCERLHSYVSRPAFVTGIRLRYSGARLTRWRAGHDTG